MNLFHADLSTIGYDDIRSFCEAGIPEGVRLDYKRELSGNSPEKQVVKAVSAFANTQGGVLLFGVGTKGTSNKPDWPNEGMPARSDLDRIITRWCIEHINPPLVPAVGYVENPLAPGKAFAVVRVELSRLTPHTVDLGKTIYVRRADNSDPLRATFAEVELLRNQRERAVLLENRHLEDLRTRLHLKPGFVPLGRSLFLIIRPEFSAEDAIPLDQLSRVANGLRTAGVRVGPILSYCQGVTSTDGTGAVVFVTGRGHLGYSLDTSRGGGPPDAEVSVTSLLFWCLVAGKSARLLCDAARYWGALQVSLEVFGHEGVKIADDSLVNLEPICVDNRITIEQSWSASVLRTDPFAEMSRLGRRLLWSVGLADETYSQEIVAEKLNQLARFRGMAF